MPAAYPYTIKVKINDPSGPPRWMYISRYASALMQCRSAYTSNREHAALFRATDGMQPYVDSLITRYDAPILDWKPVKISP